MLAFVLLFNCDHSTECLGDDARMEITMRDLMTDYLIAQSTRQRIADELCRLYGRDEPQALRDASQAAFDAERRAIEALIQGPRGNLEHSRLRVRVLADLVISERHEDVTQDLAERVLNDQVEELASEVRAGGPVPARFFSAEAPRLQG